ncbi:MAG: ribosome silencing factor [Deltaproteobacteria bacterium]|nr:ribosome silencing factor [Deltaproteobacteria bacterium]MBN2671559.1 ribosome silencing factor [Deltaproteobacteria bacterium]
MEPKQLALEIAKSALDKHAEALEIINVTGKSSYADFIIICSGRSTRQVEAIIDGVQGELKKQKVHPMGIEGRQYCQWVLLDYGDVIFHVFEDDKRGFYDLDGLWIDAERVPPPVSTPMTSAK